MDVIIGGLAWVLNHLLLSLIAAIVIYIGPALTSLHYGHRPLYAFTIGVITEWGGLIWRTICALFNVIGAWGLYTVMRSTFR